MKDSLEVCHIVNSLEVGGLETLVVQMAQKAPAATHIVSLSPENPLATRLDSGDLETTALEASASRGVVGSVMALARRLRHVAPDVAHLHNFVPQFYGAPAARLAGVPIVVSTKHGPACPRVKGSFALAGFLYRLSDTIVAVGGDVRQTLLETYGLRPNEVEVITNGVDAGKFRPADSAAEVQKDKRLGIDGRPVIGTVCRLSAEKGISTLLDAFCSVNDHLPSPRLVVVGDGPQREVCENKAENLEIEESVRFLGGRDDVEEIYPLMDIYVQPSYTEGISLTLLEASASALPVVACNVGGNPEIVVDGETGLLVPPRDSDAIAQAVLNLWEDPDASREMGRKARERVKANFSLKRMAERYADLYRGLYRRKGANRMHGILPGLFGP